MVDGLNRRQVLLASGVAGATLSGCLSMAQPEQDCVPPGQYECPNDYILLAKHEFEGCTFTQEQGACSITITDFESKDGEECEPVKFTWEVADGESCEVYNIRVNGGGDCEDHEKDGATEGTVTTDLETEGGQQAAISNVIFCGDDSPQATPEETPEETPQETPAETPEATPEGTPEATPEDTPEATPTETPEETPEETPTDSDGGKKDKDDSEEQPC